MSCEKAKTQKSVVSQNLREENFKKKKWSTLSNTPRSSRKTKPGVEEGEIGENGQNMQISIYKIISARDVKYSVKT